MRRLLTISLVFLAANNGTALCLEGDSGKVLWKERLCDAFRATPLVAGDNIYFLGKEGKTTVVKATMAKPARCEQRNVLSVLVSK